nr:MAG TPA: hypothetical protein [Caudoviricetes sp.]
MLFLRLMQSNLRNSLTCNNMRNTQIKEVLCNHR